MQHYDIQVHAVSSTTRIRHCIAVYAIFLLFSELFTFHSLHEIAKNLKLDNEKTKKKKRAKKDFAVPRVCL